MLPVPLVLFLMATAIGAPIQGTIEAHFSPNGGCREAVTSQLRSANKTVDIAIYTFTSPDIAALLDSVHDRGVTVRVVMVRSHPAAS
jgi:phosphatidylserine/phosphatidylglycerophosphate/cardiolipin synthase-like enzyme